MDEVWALQIATVLGKNTGTFNIISDKELLDYAQKIKNSLSRLAALDSVLSEINKISDELKRRKRIETASIAGAKRSINHKIKNKNVNLILNINN